MDDARNQDFVPPARQAKQALRQALRERRASSFDAASVAQASAAVAAHVEDAVRFASAQCVAVYAPTRGELDPAPLAETARRHGSRVCYPRVAAHDGVALDFHLVDELSELVTDRYGIPAPKASAPLAPAVDVFVVPGLGFDARGRRLGFGRGYYDAALRAQPSALRIGVGFDWQLLPEIPVEAHDEPVDLVVTPASCVVTRARSEGAAHPLCRIPFYKEESP